MRTSRAEAATPLAVHARIIEDAIILDLSDGRTVTAPLAWYPRLLHGTARERRHWRLIGGGEGVHWPELDEDVSVEGLLDGRPSAESQPSFEKWLAGRRPLANKRMQPAGANSRGRRTRRRARG